MSKYRMLRCALLISTICVNLLATEGYAESINRAERHLPKPSSQAELNALLIQVTEPFLGKPYGFSPLGEGGQDPQHIDDDPLYRTDLFDCTTFVETAIASAIGETEEDIIRILNRIRYQNAIPTFLNRNHFPAFEWIPHLTQEGLIEDITSQVAPQHSSIQSKRLTTAIWNHRKNKILSELPPERIPQGQSQFHMIPIAQASKFTSKIPGGTILNLVRVDYKNIPVRISHQGLILERNGTKIIRHAQDRFVHKVIDEPLEHYLKRVQNHKRWPVAGINLQRIRSEQITPYRSTHLQGTPNLASSKR